MKPFADLAPKSDVKAGTLAGGDYSSHKIPLGNGHHIKTPPLTNILQILQIVVIAGFAISWWSGRETTSNTTNSSQNYAIEANTRRLDAYDKRFSDIDRRAEAALAVAAKNADDLHELMVKFRIMVELVDGNQKKPELHR